MLLSATRFRHATPHSVQLRLRMRRERLLDSTNDNATIIVINVLGSGYPYRARESTILIMRAGLASLTRSSESDSESLCNIIGIFN